MWCAVAVYVGCWACVRDAGCDCGAGYVGWSVGRREYGEGEGKRRGVV